MAPLNTPENIATALAQRSQAANAALVRGDFDGYIAVIQPSNDCVLMGPFGGVPLRGYDLSSEGRARMAGFFKTGTFTQELVSSHVSDKLAVLVTIERIQAQIGGFASQDWMMRVTQVFERQEEEWRLVHRHADPLASGIAPDKGAALARGNKK